MRSFPYTEPNILLFDGDGSDAKLAGVSYVVKSDTPPPLFNGLAVWHRHEALCFKGGIAIGIVERGERFFLTDEECIARRGRIFSIDHLLMSHLWIGDDYIDSAPIFAHSHPKLQKSYLANSTGKARKGDTDSRQHSSHP